jgi:hypothetical protein
MKKYNIILVAVLLPIALLTSSYKKDKKPVTQTKTITLVSDMNSDGYIVNTTPKTIFKADTRLKIGWDGGFASRAFLSFNISDILPPSGKKLIINRAVLKVYEQNTNMLPFRGEEITRVVQTYLLNYSTLDANDFDGVTIADCGVITTSGSNVLKEYPLDVSIPVAGYIRSNTSVSALQFRLQLTHNENVTETSTLSNAMWCIYSGEDQGATFNNYRPVLHITYHWENK